ncbi:2-keto-3-deoxygluconate permease [Clostridium tetanomorphum]|uniref:2-keto-3-deoxygluconate permease n=1 Tax=Clostridium tetanomorphum TaxID=1553 RepID=A0A923EBG4_CLOTT|nr:2-keto-3-deoxygluconate permease [Clostridium tetanomorphum]KAJ50291.1 2-keto-3-deoxygluconate permease [Clostridium tetanomorphum DSM 665]MBC2400018.1 2-keto-3-deoxygluconate permease [Clostridium tetanomorphum]MBP1864542.1 2-keto-3-deoxygluconate permease [Clostridium tetanomorphum]NRS82926.1 2-keto-3-deoxygluconate permease [Clostridium tetanomorphum]NRZ98978.1 2-keto-3-deoxygluconate permease [Clostridium tetanomorphum]
MKILKNVQKVPGGLMVIPLLLGATINTLFPQILNIGGFTTALFKQSATALIALFVLCNGAQIDIKQAGKPLYKGIILTLTKFVIGAFIGWFIGKTFGHAGILGLTPLALVAAITNSNGGLYAALAGQYGDSTDVGAISILSLNDGPFFTMLAFGISGLANIPFIALIAVLIPILIGFVLGNLDEDMRKFLANGQSLLIPFFAFPLGAALDFRTILKAGLPGLMLGVIVVIITGFGGYFSTALFGKKRAVGAAIGTTAGNAVGTPAALALADPSLNPYVAIATAQIAAAVIVTAILCPLLVSYLDKIDKRREKVEVSA